MQFRLLIQTAAFVVSIDCSKINGMTYDLELQRNNAEIDYLHCRPEYEVRFQSRQVYILEFPRYSPPPASFRNCHECEESGETHGREYQLIEAHPLQSG